MSESLCTLRQDDAGEGHPFALAMGVGTGARLALVGQLVEGGEDAVGNGVCMWRHGGGGENFAGRECR